MQGQQFIISFKESILSEQVMGNKLQKKATHFKNKFISYNQEPNQEQTSSIGIAFQCPQCSAKFAAKSLQSDVHKHLNECLQKKIRRQQEQQKKIQQMVPSKHQHIVFNYNIAEYFYLKEPIDQTYTKFKWQKAPINIVPINYLTLSPNQIKTMGFQQKSAWFRYNIEKCRISWMNGADFMRIQKNNVLMSSLIQSKKVNMYKQVKIEFVGDKVNDAGGLLRQWMHMVIQEMFDLSTGIFKLCNTDDPMYKLKWDEEIDEQFSGELLILYGVILGKAIFEKIPISSYLDRTILRQIVSTQNHLEFYDIFGYDKQLYNSWTFILENEINGMSLDSYFVLYKEKDESSTMDLVELVEDGKDLQVTDQNKEMYVNLSIETMCKQKVSRSISFIRKGLFKVIPEQLIKVFQPYEMEMLLYGVPYIDVKDWKANTDYKGEFNITHKVIKWFWEVVETFNQQQLSRLLKFSTGSSRTPLHGFKKLQSNRGNFSKFLIESSQYLIANPYPKGHTCFNRLELPKYPSKECLKCYLSAIVNNNLDGVFGLD